MIHAAAEVLADMRVFWICYFDHEVPTTCAVLENLGVPPERQHVLRERFPGLVLLHAYQELSGSLPPRHAVFPSTHHLPVAPVSKERTTTGESQSQVPVAPISHEDATTGKLQTQDQSKKEPTIAEKKEKTFQQARQALQACTGMEAELGADGQLRQPRTRCVILHGQPQTGGMALGAKLFDEQFEEGHQAVWADLDEIGSVNDLFETLLHSVARKAGISDWMPVVLSSLEGDSRAGTTSPISDAQVHELARMTNSPNRNWVIFINARSGPAKNLELSPEAQVHPGLKTEVTEKHHNEWMDTVPEPGDRSDPMDEDFSANGPFLIELLKRIGGEECPNVSIVLLCFDGPFVFQCVPRLKPFPYQICLSIVETPIALAVDRAVEWIDKGSDHEGVDERLARIRFLWSLCLVNRARFLAMLWQWPFHQTIEVLLEDRKKTTERFLKNLEEDKVIRRKNGGFVWMHCGVRNELRERLFRKFKEDVKVPDFTRADIHHGIAEWYHRVFRATADAAAGFEIVYHRCRQVRDLLTDFRPDDADKLGACASRIRDALGDASLALARARPSMLALGFSKGLCRRLHALRQQLLNDVVEPLKQIRPTARSNRASAKAVKTFINDVQRAVAALQDQSIVLNRQIAVEVGENVTALHRHLQLRGLQYARQYPRKASPEDASMRRAELNPKLVLEQRDGEPLSEWMQSILEIATLGIAVRSYAYAKTQLRTIFDRLGLDERLYRGGHSVNEPKLDELLQAWLQRADLRDAEVLQQMIIALRRNQQLVLAQEMTKVTDSERRTRNTSATVHWEYHAAHRSYETAIRLFRRLAGIRKLAPQSENALAKVEMGLDRVWHRLVVHHALTLAYQQDFTQAHARLNDAEALLTVSAVAPHALDWGIIELMRAEVLTQQVLYRVEPDVGSYNAFGEFRRAILACLTAEDAEHRGIKTALLKQLEHLADKAKESAEERAKTWCKAKSYIADAWQALSRAERSLKQFRKNVWWTTWFFELQIKLAELEIFLALLLQPNKKEGNQAARIAVHHLPHLGPEAAAFAVPTLMERLLDNSERMVRHDLYRLARVVESFGNSIQAALLFQLRLDPGQLRAFLGIRLELLCRRLREAEKSLRRRHERRRKVDATTKGKPTELDKNVVDYVEFVLDHCDRVCQCVSVASDAKGPEPNTTGTSAGDGSSDLDRAAGI